MEKRNDLQERLLWATAKAEGTQASIPGVVNGTPGAVGGNNGEPGLVVFPIFSSLRSPVDDFVPNSPSWIHSPLLCPLAFETCNILWQNFRGKKQLILSLIPNSSSLGMNQHLLQPPCSLPEVKAGCQHLPGTKQNLYISA